MTTLTVTETRDRLVSSQTTSFRATLRIQREDEKRVIEPEKELKTIIERMKEGCKELSSQYQQEVLTVIAEFEEEFFQNYRIDSKDNIEQKKAINALCFFYFNHVEFIKDNYAQGDAEKDAWKAFEKDLVDIIQSILPPDENVHAFMNNYKRNDSLCNLLLIGQQKCQNLEGRLYDSANQTNETAKALFNEGQKELLVFIDTRQQNVTQMHAEIKSPVDKLRQLYSALERQQKTVQEIDNEAVKQKNRQTKNLTHIKNLLNKD